MTQFTWLPVFEEMLSVVCEKYDKFSLCEVFYELFGKLGGLTDKFSDGSSGPLKEMDPLTFIAYFNRNMTFDNRIGFYQTAKNRMELDSSVPDDLEGIPTLDSRNTWFFTYSKGRGINDIDNLWEFSKRLKDSTLDDQLFRKILNIKKVGLPKLTVLMYLCKPNDYLSFDTTNCQYLKKFGFHQIHKQVLKSPQPYKEYQSILREIKDKFDKKPFSQISYDAWKDREKLGEGEEEQVQKPDDLQIEKTVRYWLIAPGTQAKFWGEWKSSSIITIGWDKIGDLSKYSSKDELQIKIQDKYGDATSQNNSALACYEFARVMKPGDIVIAKTGTKELLGYGEVVSDYKYDKTRTLHCNLRNVKWKKTGNWIYPFTLNDTKRFTLKTLTDITKYEGFPEQLIKFIETQGIGDIKEFSYWWINANPNIWTFSDLKIGETQTYTTKSKKGNKRRIYKHFTSVAPGDIVIGYVSNPDKVITSICEITKGIHQTDQGESIEFKKIEDFEVPLSWNELKSLNGLEKCEPLVGNQGSLFKLTREEFELIRDKIDEKNEPVIDIEVKPYSIEIALEDLFFSREEFQEMLDTLDFKKNVIMQGAPGVGKTFIAKRLAYTLMRQEDPKRVQMIQFHQSYSYEDFIQGYRPDEKHNFKLKNGVFHDFCKKAQRDSENKYVFIIDEINRGNLSKIFGELMMLIEPDKRGKDYSVPLTYTEAAEDQFFIPDNLYLIGTMNTADRSLAMVDYALRRRFAFITLTPKFETKEFKLFLRKKGVHEALINKIVVRMCSLNDEISKDQKNLGIGYQIGHSFFCPNSDAKYDDEWYQRVINYEIRPLIEEYWFDDIDGVNQRVKRMLE